MNKRGNPGLLFAIAVLGGMAAAGTYRKRTYDVRGKTVFLTGGSRGVGLILAREFASRGAKVAPLIHEHCTSMRRSSSDSHLSAGSVSNPIPSRWPWDAKRFRRANGVAVRAVLRGVEDRFVDLGRPTRDAVHHPGLGIAHLIRLGASLLSASPDICHDAGPRRCKHHTFVDALNVSLGSLITLAGDMMPTTRLPRFLMGLQGVEGFALLTASVSWLLSVYPVLETARSFAQEAMSLYKAGRDTHMDLFELPEAEAQSLIHVLAVQLATVRNQMVQFPVTYYFNVGERKTGLAVVMPFVAYLADRASDDERAGVRFAGSVLSAAVNSFAEFVGETFLHMPKSDRVAVLLALARDHMRDPIGLELLGRRFPHEGVRKAS